jgi:hypothetical protein
MQQAHLAWCGRISRATSTAKFIFSCACILANQQLFTTAVGRLAQLVERFVYTEDVGSSSLSSPTSPRPLGFGLASQEQNVSWSKVLKLSRWSCVCNVSGPCSKMKYVYILQSEIGHHFYVGITDDLRQHLTTHNVGYVSHTAKLKP